MAFTRRRFIRTGSLAAGGSLVLPTIIPSCVFGSNDKINLGMIGTGSHGISWNLAAYLKLDDCRIITACDVDLSRMKKAKSIIDKENGNHGASGLF